MKEENDQEVDDDEKLRTGCRCRGGGNAGTDRVRGSGTDDSGASSSGKPRIKLVINGGLGDKSFFDSAYEGLKRSESKLGYELKVVELGSDRTKWEPGFEDAAAADDYDILAAGTFDVTDYIGELAPQYPDKKFWVFDSAVDYSGKNGCSNKCENVYSMTFKQNEGGYLAGFLAEKLVAEKALKGAESLNKVGVVGGVKIPVIEDFIIGFKAGFKAVGGRTPTSSCSTSAATSPSATPPGARRSPPRCTGRAPPSSGPSPVSPGSAPSNRP